MPPTKRGSRDKGPLRKVTTVSGSGRLTRSSVRAHTNATDEPQASTSVAPSAEAGEITPPVRPTLSRVSGTARRGRLFDRRSTRSSAAGNSATAGTGEPEPVPDSTAVPCIRIPTTPEESRGEVVIVDLATPRPSLSANLPPRRPVEVDLTCEPLDDEVFVVLEDIVNPTRRHHHSGRPLPIRLGASPPSRHVRYSPYNRAAVGNSSRGAGSSSNNQETSSTGTNNSSDLVITGEVGASTSGHQDASVSGIHCPICLDTLAQVKGANKQMNSTTCGHLFCGPCITEVMNSKVRQCPTCRRNLDSRNIHPIFI